MNTMKNYKNIAMTAIMAGMLSLPSVSVAKDLQLVN